MLGRFTSRKITVAEPVVEPVVDEPSFLSPIPEVAAPEIVPDAAANKL
jgi:hypothetical protein